VYGSGVAVKVSFFRSEVNNLIFMSVNTSRDLLAN
jgi:hypothetical protein